MKMMADTLRLSLLAFVFAFFVVAFAQCKQAQVAVSDGVKLIACIDDHLGEPAAQIIVDCAAQEVTGVVDVIEARKALAIKRQQPCTTIVVDAGAPIGPGR